MELNQAISYVLEQKAILFAGSGFSYGAKNFKNEKFKQGEDLKNALLKDCGINSSDAALSTVADYYIDNKSDKDLIEFLRNEFSVKSVADWHTKIMATKWKRVYTTNYDNVIEYSSRLSKINLQPLPITQETSNYNLSSVCFHLNGYIEELNSETLNNEFKLTDYSYSCDSLEGKPGFEFMKNDFKSAKAIVFIGYSLNSDLDVLRLLSSPQIAAKTIFIDKKNADEISISRFKKYGTYYGIGIEEFAQKLTEAATSFVDPVGTIDFESFIFENMKPLLEENIQYDDLLNLFLKGSYKESLCSKEHYSGFDGNYKYLVERKALYNIIANIYNKKVFLITSDLGNGKTILCHLIRNELRNTDINIFTFKNRLVDLDDEISNICSIHNKHNIVILENYQSKLDILRLFSYYGIRNITFVLTARRSVNTPNFRKLISTLGINESDVYPIFLDRLVDDDVKKLSVILSTHNILSEKFPSSKPDEIEEYIYKNCHSRFSDLLLELFNSSNIKSSINDNYKEISKNVQIKKLVIFTLLKSSMNLEIDLTDFLNIMKLDYTLLSAKDNIAVNEFFEFNENEIKIKSSIVARELLLSCIDLSDIIDCLKEIIFSVDNDHYQYKNLLQNIVSHTHYSMFLKKENAIPLIKNFYNSIRNTNFCSNNPFYWEQFAATCIDSKNFDEANQCLSTAFVKAKEIDGFIPFQVETIKANCILEEVLFKSSTKILDGECVINALVDSHCRLLKYFDHPDNNIKFVFRIGVKYKRIFDYYKDVFDARQKSIFMEKRAEMLKRMKENSNDCSIEWIHELEKCRF